MKVPISIILKNLKMNNNGLLLLFEKETKKIKFVAKI